MHHLLKQPTADTEAPRNSSEGRIAVAECSADAGLRQRTSPGFHL